MFSLFRKSILRSAIALAALNGACSESPFTSQGKMKDGNNNANVTGSPLPSQSVNKSCEVDLSYNPSQVDCYIPVSGNHIWRNSGVWKDRVNSFPPADAANAGFISPLPRAADQADRCPIVPGIEKLIYVSRVSVTNPGRYSFAAIIDDFGSVRIWKNSDPRQEIIKAEGNGLQLAAATVDLEAASYAIVIDATDGGQVTTGMAFTLMDAAGQVLKHSSPTSGWCIFRVPAAEDVASYVPKAAGCRVCFAGGQ